jgi:adenylate cyclase
MTHSQGAKPGFMGRVWENAREHASNAVVGGAILVVTGFTPEHWVAEILHTLHLSDVRSQLPSVIDGRLLVLSAGVAIIVGDVLWRKRRPRAATASVAPATVAAVIEGVSSEKSASLAPDFLPLPDKPSIAVLPFQNMSGDPEQDYFADGIVEDIITDLSKISGLMVISRNSTFTYKGKAIDAKQVGRDLGVRYVLEGSVRKAGNRVRITGQLIDAVTGGHLWAERYDRDLTDIFEIQDDVTRRIVDALKVTLSPAENARLADSGTHNIDAYDYFLRGREFLLGENKNREKFEQSLKLLTRALELDPNYSQAYAGLSWAHMFDYSNRWSDNPDNSLQLAKHNAEQAVQKDPNEPLARFAASLAAMFGNDLDRAKSEADTALSLNPNFALAYATLGTICAYSGQPLVAITAIERAMRLDPAWSQQYLHFLGTAYLLAGKYETAAALLRQRVLLVPGTDFTRAILASALGHLGEIDEARRIWRELKEINPKYSFSEHFARQPFKREEDVRRIAEGLAKAGLST